MYIRQWISGWGTAQQLTPAAVPEESTIKIGNQTVRMVARTTAAGAAVRVALANSFGVAPVRVASARIASARITEPDGGGGGVHRLTFAGRPEVTIPPGACLTSDPVECPVTAQADLVVSLHVPDQGVIPTTHEVGLRTAWLAPGDQTAAPELDDATPFRSYLWLTGVDVLAEPDAATIVAFGDSVVDGMETTPGADAAWPSVLARRLAARPDLPPRAVVNMGIAGNRILRETDGLGAAGLARFDRDVLARPGVRWVVLSEGLNDLMFGLLPGGEPVTAEDLVAGYRLLIARAHAYGIRMIGCTLLPVGGAGIDGLEPLRQDVNRWIRESGAFDAVVDQDAAVRDPDDPARVRPGLLAHDGVHPNDEGHRVLAGAVNPELFRAT
ncbi:putative GDSL-like lipase/acylhydrolase [Actinoplanes missouriensis 431]|uniref:Putative GDSL-like lipase/acylhydrolase n=1 Tax=Actinoplanes missouriensis (strain ATCC 14538 / DSM 43046 / CBS 188.64 / JCM 3121 / NBRC 102363 / NCIMB 12654 / NRRL B-3342 / UNCC 431) TaxID=512565 RepID=I0H5M1_ACTM4|nr:SGNH/GDSL hydrolase family protein [Actinoplanes missouriensis]BAL88308.1 putative GDSL-like lipase/acylhydrolase [Actinoplanes missouriensis 431]